jgi:hypothetical protein
MPPARLAAVLIIALALALPAAAVGQVTPRMGGVL